MKDQALNAIRDLIQEDIGRRGLHADAAANLIDACAGDFAAACRSLAETPNAAVAVVTGFYIPHARPPAAETDGPLGAVFLARALTGLGIRVALITDSFCSNALSVGINAAGLHEFVRVLNLPPNSHPWTEFLRLDWPHAFLKRFPLTHLISLERVGPSHDEKSLKQQSENDEAALVQFVAEVPAEHQDRCHTMKGRDITADTSPAHLLFEALARSQQSYTTIGIGDGGNEIGMGKIPWDVIRRNIPRGGLIACRVPTDHLIVCGISNWGAYGLAAGVRLLLDADPDPELFDVDRERELLQLMVEKGPLVDGVSGQQTVTVDGVPFEQYVRPLRTLASGVA